jgi:hypothetical protein
MVRHNARHGFATANTANVRFWSKPYNTELECQMKIVNLSATLMAAGLLIAAPAFAQTKPADKQKTQEMLVPSPNPGPNPPLKQKTQESLAPSPNPGPNLPLKQKTQESSTLDPSPNPGPNPPLKQR